jgi:hypothetical protein
VTAAVLKTTQDEEKRNALYLRGALKNFVCPDVYVS